jgi:hypothetical protein
MVTNQAAMASGASNVPNVWGISADTAAAFSPTPVEGRETVADPVMPVAPLVVGGWRITDGWRAMTRVPSTLPAAQKQLQRLTVLTLAACVLLILLQLFNALSVTNNTLRAVNVVSMLLLGIVVGISAYTFWQHARPHSVAQESVQ